MLNNKSNLEVHREKTQICNIAKSITVLIKTGGEKVIYLIRLVDLEKYPV